MLLFHVFWMVFMKVLESSVLSFGMCGFVIVDISFFFNISEQMLDMDSVN